MKKAFVGFTFLLIGIVFFASATPAVLPSTQKNWTILFYTSTDNNLELYAFRDFAKLTASRIQGNTVSAHVWMDTTNFGSWHAVVDGNPYDENTVRMQRLVNQDMSDMATLKYFVQQTVENYPAQRYALIFQGHGSGWYLGVEEGKPVSSARIAQVIRNLGISFEFIGFDMCLLSNIETLYEFKDLTKYIIASEDYGPWEGLVDAGLLEQFATETDTLKILQFMARKFIERNEIGDVNDATDISILATARVSEFANFLVQHEADFLSIPHLFGPTYSIDRSETEPYQQLQDLYSLAQEAFVQDTLAWKEFQALFSQVVIGYQQNQEKINQPYAKIHYGLSIVVNGQDDDFDTEKTYQEMSFPLRLEWKP